MNSASIVLRLAYRNFRAAMDKSSIVFQIVFPLIFTYIQGFAYTGIIPPFNWNNVTVHYPAFMASGAVIFAVINSGWNTGWLVWSDRRQAMLQQLLVGPFTRSQYILSVIVANAMIAFASAIAVLIFAWPVFAGTTIITPLGALYMLAALGLGSLLFGSIYIAFSIKMRTYEAFQTFSPLVFFLFTFTSSLFYPADRVPAIMQSIFFINPATYTADALRAGLLAQVGPASPSSWAYCFWKAWSCLPSRSGHSEEFESERKSIERWTNCALARPPWDILRHSARRRS